MIQTLTLIYTLQCNACCKHCGFECSPRNSASMEYEDAKNWIISASKINTIKKIAISGGESFLRYDEIVELIQLSSDLGLETRILHDRG